MRRHRRRTRFQGAQTHRWMISYADFLTLLFAFFVFLLVALGRFFCGDGDFGDHLPLAPARRKRLALYNSVVGLADTIFKVLAQQGVNVLCASLLTTALAYMPSA